MATAAVATNACWPRSTAASCSQAAPEARSKPEGSSARCSGGGQPRDLPVGCGQHRRLALPRAQAGLRIYSVRQNLSLLVRNGHPAAALGAWTYWGATLSGGELVARSALGENAKGQLIYVASMSASPADLATALVRFRARSAMELDINPEWVQLAYAKKPGWRLQAGVTGQARPADQYLIGWTRDFIAVMARG